MTRALVVLSLALVLAACGLPGGPSGACNPRCPIHDVEGVWTGSSRAIETGGIVYEYRHTWPIEHTFETRGAPGSAECAQ